MGCTESSLDDRREAEKPDEDKDNVQYADEGEGAWGIISGRGLASLMDGDFDGDLFIDPDFVPEKSSLFFSEPRSADDIAWKRPRELVDNPVLVASGTDRSDMTQGELGDCWFLSACAALTQKPDLCKQVIPPQQELSPPRGPGLAFFRFWRFGNWVQVCVDDFLPTRNGRLIYAHSSTDNEFWPALIEKAYAKLNGSYEAIEGGHAMDALVDLTGGVAEAFNLQQTQNNAEGKAAPGPIDLFEHVLRSFHSGAFITCSKKGNWQDANVADEFGLVSGHAYTVTFACRLRQKGTVEQLIRVRNPWNNAIEWSGAWSDSDERWQQLSQTVKERLQLQQQGDGEFWMEWSDFIKHFSKITICMIGPNLPMGSMDESNNGVYYQQAFGEWKLKYSAGGSRNSLKDFAKNPQFMLTLEKTDGNELHSDVLADEEEEVVMQNGAEASDTCSVLIALMQNYRAVKRNSRVKRKHINFLIYKLPEGHDPNNRLPDVHFRTNYETGKSGVYINYREVVNRFQLEAPATYCIVPSTFQKNQSGQFLLRVFANQPFSLIGPLDP